MRTPPIPPTGESELAETPAEIFADQESDPTDYRGSDAEGIEQAQQRPTGSGGSATPADTHRAGPPE